MRVCPAEDDLEGLIHISEISEKRIEHPKEVLHEGDTVTLRVIKIDPENHRIGLSLRKVELMAYADMDWQSLEDDLKEEEAQEGQPASEEKPVAEEKPAEEKPAEDKPADDKPAEDKPAEDNSADEQPADK